MGFYARLTHTQVCVLCGALGKFCVCSACEATFVSRPNRCFSCAATLQSNLQFCGTCLRQSPSFSATHTAYDYSGNYAHVIREFKFAPRLCIGDYLAHQLFDLYQKIGVNYDAIVPMPLSNSRLKSRGFNQVHELLRVIKRRTNVKIDTESVRRIKATTPLFALSADDRRREIKGAFVAKNLNYQRVLLVDDVMTTGASLNELSKTLIRAGVKKCDVMTLARAVLR